jgi:hypothetical protein
MRRGWILSIVAAVLVITAGCVTTPTREYRWQHASGEGDFKKDSFDCEGIAARTYPAANVRQTVGGGQTTNCMRIGNIMNCSSGDDGYSYVADSNRESRTAYYAKCLESRGWERAAVGMDAASVIASADHAGTVRAINFPPLDWVSQGRSMWSRCLVGQRFYDGKCLGEPLLVLFSEQRGVLQAITATFPNQEVSVRSPSVAEMSLLVSNSRQVELSPDPTGARTCVWTRETSTGSEDSPFHIWFGGDGRPQIQTGSAHQRCALRPVRPQ